MKKRFLIIFSCFLVISLAGLGAAFYMHYFQDIKIKKVTQCGTFSNFRDTIPQKDTSKQNILLIGDSMAYSLMFRAKKLL